MTADAAKSRQISPNQTTGWITKGKTVPVSRMDGDVFVLDHAQSNTKSRHVYRKSLLLISRLSDRHRELFVYEKT